MQEPAVVAHLKVRILSIKCMKSIIYGLSNDYIFRKQLQGVKSDQAD